MPTTVANRLTLAKEVWDSDTMVKQFYDACPWLDMIEKRQRVVIGKRAQVPVHLDRAGGTTIFSSAGSSGTTPGVDAINTSGAEVVNQAQYNMVYNYFPVGFQVGSLNEITGGGQSVGDAFEHTISQAIKNIRNHITRQFLTGHGRIAAMGAGGASTTWELATPAETPAGEVSGYHALGMGWIVADDRLQAGTIADPDLLTTNALVASYTESETDPDVVTNQSITTTLSSGLANHFVRLASNGTSVPTIESTGLVDIAGTTGNTVGAISGASVSRWNPAFVDNQTTIPDLEFLLKMSRRVGKKVENGELFCLTSLAQLDAIYSFLQAQVRFTGDKELGAGGSEQVKWRGQTLHAFPQVPDNFLFYVDMDSLEIVVGKYAKPVWLSDLHGAGMLRDPRQTVFEDTVMYALGLAARRRNGMAAATNLSATV